MIALKRSGLSSDSIFILIIPRGEYYQYSYQKFCGLEIEDLNDIGISVNWITNAELYDDGYGGEPADKVYRAMTEAIK